MHVSPQLFLRDKGLLGKKKKKKIIPFYVSHSIDGIYTHAYFMDNIPIGTKPQILIDDVSKFIENPVKPTPQKCSDEVLNQILIDNIDDVLNQF